MQEITIKQVIITGGEIDSRKNECVAVITLVTLESGIVVLVGIIVLVGTFGRINKRTGGNKHTGGHFYQSLQIKKKNYIPIFCILPTLFSFILINKQLIGYK